MAHLSISLLGSFLITSHGETIREFKSNRTRALLAYLAVEADQPHRRERLAGLLWPDWPDREALNNLRSTLSNLRLAIGDRGAEPPFLIITRDSIQMNPRADIDLDVSAFTNAVDAIRTSSPIGGDIEQAVGRYHGNFLEGFSIGDSPEFEEWALLTRERLAREADYALHSLASVYEKNGNYSKALTYAWRRIELDPLDETAHQQLMRNLALCGQRSAAMEQYEACAGILAKELGVKPAEETTRLYEQIRGEKLKPEEPLAPSTPDLAPQLPSFLLREYPQTDSSVFVARERELAQLDKHFEQALAGHGRVVFITGEAGSGKTSLIQEFSRRTQAAYAELCVASGNCNAYTGIGDPYLPFREILELLTGKIEAGLAAGAITREHALRLWNTLPEAVQALTEAGPDLIDTLLLREALLERATTYTSAKPGWLTHLMELLDRKQAPEMIGTGLQQIDLFEQYTTVLQILASQRPIILVLDDLQWADLGSVSLLFHLGRRLAGNRILILGAYRPEEVTVVKTGTRHAIEPVINEFRRLYGDLEVNVDCSENREFVDALINSEPNHLGPSFRKMLLQQTGGHPLFTVELLRGMQERGDLAKDANQYWIEGASLDWDTLPARVEAAIRERVNRLPDALQRALSIACVEGEIFTAEVVAQVMGENERETVQYLSGDLVRKHRLINAQAIERLGSKRISHYRFRSYLIQKYLYDNLDTAERAYLHEDVGKALEELYGEQASEIAVQLARHFQEAKIVDKAIQYLHQAGDRAMQLSAYQEAITHITKALELLMSLPDSTERANQELNLQISLAKASLKDLPTPAWKEGLTKARELSQQTGNVSRLYLILGELSCYHYVRAEYQTALELAKEAQSLAQQTGDPLDATLGSWFLGFIFFALGNLSSAKLQFDRLISFYQPALHKTIVALRGSDTGLSSMAYYACCLWCLGFPDQAEKMARQALSLAYSYKHDFSTIEVLCYGGCMLSNLQRDWEALYRYSREMTKLANENGFIGWLGTSMTYQGNAWSMLGHLQEGISKTLEAITFYNQLQIKLNSPGILCLLAQAYQMLGHLDESSTTLEQAIKLIEQTEEHFWEAEIYRVKAQLLLEKNDAAEAEACLLKSIDVARRQEAKSWELRTAIDLSRLWQSHGKKEEAYSLLANIYNWFTEGFDTPDLVEAHNLLAEFAQ